MKRDIIKNLTIIIILLLLLVVLIVAFKAGFGEKVNTVEVSDKRLEYYDKLDKFEDNYRDTMEKYITAYIKYNGYNIPESESILIIDNTEEELYKNNVSHRFSNTRTEQTMIGSDHNEYQAEVGRYGEEGEEYTNEKTTSADTLMRISYNFKENTYIAKVCEPRGITYNIFFKVKDRKVVSIHEW